jgi:hypothetical protein
LLISRPVSSSSGKAMTMQEPASLITGKETLAEQDE